jgi:hypothetical protein
MEVQAVFEGEEPPQPVLRIFNRHSPNQSVNLVALGKEELG